MTESYILMELYEFEIQSILTQNDEYLTSFNIQNLLFQMWDNQLLIVAQPESHINKEEINKKIE